MNRLMSSYKDVTLTSVLVTLLILCWGAGDAIAQENRINVEALTDETQKLLSDADRITMVWWIPEEYWQATFAQDPSITKADALAFMKALSPYTLFVVADGKIGTFGGVTYQSEPSIRSTMQLIDSQKAIYLPLSKENIDVEARSLLSVMKPVLSNLLGQLGENMNFIVFPSKSKAGLKIVDVRGEGSFSVKLGESSFKWKLPLGAVLPANTCPVDGERLSGSWKFCPEHGAKLISKPIK